MGVITLDEDVVVGASTGTTVPDAYKFKRLPAPQNSVELPEQTMLQSVKVAFLAPEKTLLSQKHWVAYSTPANE